MQHDLSALAMGTARQVLYMGGVGKERVGNGAGKCEGLLTCFLVIAHVVDDHGDHRLVRTL